MRPRNVSVSLVEQDGKLKAWGITFTLPGFLPRKDGKVDEAARKELEKKLAKLLETVDFQLEQDKNPD